MIVRCYGPLLLSVKLQCHAPAARLGFTITKSNAILRIYNLKTQFACRCSSHTLLTGGGLCISPVVHGCLCPLVDSRSATFQKNFWSIAN